ncbi:hypothetical protein D0864_11895 [Hortaea werneckii]|uniref:Uncharacterized protein n=1 Tax=Hortaea werneckii TaxID=91943 RepID=A0A3M7DPV4_HORWE|nr:hypothetical protein D0864_11895 [Hortaea werneckii]
MQSAPALTDGVGGGQSVGVLTKTVIRSSVCIWLLHARLRPGGNNDLVQVGEDFIEVSQVGAEGQLERVATKTDFDCRIRAAKVFSIDPEHSEEDLLIKREDLTFDGKSPQAPPDLLVLALDSQDLVFIYLEECDDGAFRFVQQSCPLPSFDNALHQPGEHLAVDPHTRALAVAASEQEVMLFSAKSRESIKSEIQSGDRNWCPVSAQRPVKVEGVIQHAEFLIPPEDDKDHIVLLLIVVDQRKTKAVRVDWSYSSDVHYAQKHPGIQLDSVTTVPSLLIPLRDAAFLIVRGSEIVKWQYILSGSPSAKLIPRLDTDPTGSGESPRKPVWANWCRPRRSQGARREMDHIYLVREDGFVYLAHVGDSNATSSLAGHLECHVSSAFASLGNAGDPDILAVAGDMSTGRVVSIGHWPNHRVSTLSWPETMEMATIQTIPNWATVTDAVTAMYRHTPSKSTRPMQSSASILVTSGRQPYGKITELRYGLEARLSAYFELEGLGSTTGMWAVPVPTTGEVLIFLANPFATRLLTLAYGDEELEPAEIDASECTALDLEQPTIAAVSDSEHRIVQVTRFNIIVTAGLSAHFEDTFRRPCNEGFSILAAAVETSQCVIVTAEMKADEFKLCSTRFPTHTEAGADRTTMDGPSNEDTMRLVSVPSAIDIVAGDDDSLVCVLGFTDGRLALIDISGTNQMTLRSELTFPTANNDPAVCDSIAILHAPNDRWLAVCGLRDGRLFAVTGSHNEKDESCFDDSAIITLGQSAVKLVKMQNSSAQACALTGTTTCLLSWDGGSAQSLSVQSIWVCDRNNPELSQDAVAACAQLPGEELLTSPQLSDSLVLVSGDEVFVTSLVPSPTTVPRQVGVSGTPTRMINAEQQRCLVVASIKTAVRKHPNAAVPHPEQRRQIWPVIEFIPARDCIPSFSYDMQPGERVYSMVEWSLKLSDESDDKRYSFILVIGSYVRSNGEIGGRITFLQPVNRDWEVVDVQKGRAERFEAPVYALALYDEVTYVVCYGRQVTLRRFSIEERRWKEATVPFQLNSPGVYITVEASLLYISTLQDSLVVLRMVSTSDGSLPKLEAVAMGPQAHQSLSHLVVHPDQEESLTLLATKNEQLVGLLTPKSCQEPKFLSAEITFQAHLGRSLTRIRQIDMRPPWKPEAPSGVTMDDIVGTAPDGSLIGIAVIEPQLWKPLFWLQRICEWNEELSPHTYLTPPYIADDGGDARRERLLPIGLRHGEGYHGEEIMLRARAPHSAAGDMHINGDVLARLLEKGGEGLLREILSKMARKDDRVGAWVKANLEAELAAVDDVMVLVRKILDRWL